MEKRDGAAIWRVMSQGKDGSGGWSGCYTGGLAING